MADAPDVDGLAELVLLPAGATFGNYVIHECIGQGAMGNVYRAEHTLLAKPVALKVMDASLLTSADARQRFLREGQAAAAIKHPNVVDITDVGVFDGTPYLVMELLEGEDLQLHLQRWPQLAEREIAGLLLPIAAALGAAHDRGVVHRDLKPSNIFLSRGPDGEFVPKILDFGISKIAQAMTTTDLRSTPFNQLMGSPLYLPPEAVRGARDLTAKSDQYSLGVVLYECVTGQPPFAGDSLLSILESITAGDFIKPSHLRFDISEVMERIILRAMNPDPALRYDHVRDLGRELLEVAGLRTQMLWGRAFGRLDLSEPSMPTGPNVTAPLALTRPSTESPAAQRPRHGRRVWIGLATLAAILLPNLWGMRASDPAPASAASSVAREPETGEASLRPALDAPPPAPEPSVASPELPPPAANPDPSPPSAEAQAGSARATPSAAERPRSPKRARPAPSVEPRPPRVSLVPESRPRLVPPQVAPELYLEDVGRLFPPLDSPRDGAPRPPVKVLTGANESPILD